MNSSDSQRQNDASVPTSSEASSANQSISKGWAGWFRRTAQPVPSDQPLGRTRDTLQLQNEYQDMVRDRCSRHGIDPQRVRVEALSLGYSHGREVYVVLVRAKEDVATAMQLAFFAPSIEKKVGATVRSTWIGDYTQFAGLWTQWPSQISVPDEIRAMLQSLRQKARNAA